MCLEVQIVAEIDEDQLMEVSVCCFGTDIPEITVVGALICFLNKFDM